MLMKKIWQFVVEFLTKPNLKHSIRWVLFKILYCQLYSLAKQQIFSYLIHTHDHQGGGDCTLLSCVWGVGWGVGFWLLVWTKTVPTHVCTYRFLLFILMAAIISIFLGLSPDENLWFLRVLHGLLLSAIVAKGVAEVKVHANT